MNGYTIPGTGYHFETREEAEAVAVELRERIARPHTPARGVVSIIVALGAALCLWALSGCACEPDSIEFEAPAVVAPYDVASSHLREELLQASGETVTASACELETMRGSPGVYGSSPFDRLTHAQAVLDFFVSPQAFDAYATEHEPEFEALAQQMREVRQRAYDKAEGCAP